MWTSLSITFHSISISSFAVLFCSEALPPPLFIASTSAMRFHSPVFCEIKMPVMVPAKPVIVAKTSLFHERKSAKCAISKAVKLKVNAMANFTPRTKRSLGAISSAGAAVLSVVLRRVKARFTQSAMVTHPLLPQDAA